MCYGLVIMFSISYELHIFIHWSFEIFSYKFFKNCWGERPKSLTFLNIINSILNVKAGISNKTTVAESTRTKFSPTISNPTQRMFKQMLDDLFRIDVFCNVCS